MTRSAIELASRIDRGNYIYPYYLGLDELFNMTSYDPRKAILSFRKALNRYPLHFYSWYCLARAYYDVHERDKAVRLFDKMLDVLTIDDELVWNSGVFLFVKGERERGFRFLGKYLILNPRGFQDVLDLCYRLGIGIDDILLHILDNKPQYHEPLLSYLAGRKKIDDIEYVWHSMPQNTLKKSVKLKLCDAAIGEHRHALAMDIWENFSAQKKVRNSISNGDFEHDPAGGCYGWRVGKAQGVMTGIDRDFSVSGIRSFHVQFDGKHNPGVMILRQTVLVDGGSRYNLDAYIRTENITTSNGLFFRVSGSGCKMKTASSEQFNGTTRWSPVRVEFATPHDCTAVTVTLSRTRSTKFNNKIGGLAWIDTVSLSKME